MKAHELAMVDELCRFLREQISNSEFRIQMRVERIKETQSTLPNDWQRWLAEGGYEGFEKSMNEACEYFHKHPEEMQDPGEDTPF